MPSGQRVYIGNIPHDVRERDVEKFFKGYGRIKDVVIKNGYGFVEFDDYRDADDAVHDLDGKDFEGGRVRVELAKDPRRGGSPSGGRFGDRGRRGNPPGPRTKYRIIVENVSSKTSWQDLKDYFRSAGEITYTNVHHQRNGEGIVEFANRRGMDYALDHKDELELEGRRLKIYEERRSRSRSRSRSDSRGRSRTRSRTRDRSRTRSRSRDRKRKSKTRSPSKSRSRSRDRSRSRSRSNDRTNGN